MLPGEFLSSIVLHPDTSCEQIAQQLDLGPLRHAATPQEAGLVYDSISVTSANGAKLSGWFIPAQRDGQLESNPLGTVLMTHGTDGSIPCAIPWGAVAALNKFHAVLFDYQGFGDSEGTANLATLLDDADAVLSWVLTDASASRQKVHLLGVSLGTGPAFGLAALRDRPQIQSVMVDGVFDPQQQLDAAAQGVSFIFPLAGQSGREAFAWMFDMRENLGSVRVPVMIITAELDAITPPSGAEALQALLPTVPANAWRFNGLGHVQPLFKLTENYVSLAVTFWRDPSAVANPYMSDFDPTIVVPQLTP
jgi:hypothetical protein